MQITLNITKKFNSLVNHDFFLDVSEMKPYIFFAIPPKTSNGIFEFEFELMNFGLNMNFKDEMENVLKASTPYFDDIVNSDYMGKSIMIFGKAKFQITEVKGIDVQLGKGDEVLYYNDEYTIEKGDFKFCCGGFSEFSPYYTLLNIIAKKEAQASITFSSDEYILMDKYSMEFEQYVSSKQTPYDYKTSSLYTTDILNEFDNKVPKSFNLEYAKGYFKLIFSEDGLNTTVAFKGELDDVPDVGGVSDESKWSTIGGARISKK